MTYNVRPCPECGCSDVRLMRSQPNSITQIFPYFWCDACGYNAPARPTVREARAAWNARARQSNPND